MGTGAKDKEQTTRNIQHASRGLKANRKILAHTFGNCYRWAKVKERGKKTSALLLVCRPLFHTHISMNIEKDRQANRDTVSCPLILCRAHYNGPIPHGRRVQSARQFSQWCAAHRSRNRQCARPQATRLTEKQSGGFSFSCKESEVWCPNVSLVKKVRDERAWRATVQKVRGITLQNLNCLSAGWLVNAVPWLRGCLIETKKSSVRKSILA